MTQMPTWDGSNAHILRYLSDGAVRSLGEIRQSVADLAGLSPDQRAEPLPSGQSKADNRIGWATSYLTRVDAIERPARARYRITSVGLDLLARHPDVISEHLLRTMAKPGDEWWVIKRADGGTPPDIDEPEPLDPMEQIEEGLARIQADVAADMLRRLQNREPAFFERAVLALLIAMGYGGADAKVTVTPYSNDGGIDGVIDRDSLGLDRIYVQAKRYATGNAVQRPEVQAFVGALIGKATTGVFLTTGKFSKGAEDYAQNATTRVVLIDGRRLTELMIRYGVGVQTRQSLNVVAVDEDFFE